MLPYKFFPLGDNAITIELGNIISEEINQQVIALAEYLQQQKIIGVKDIIPTYTTVTVVYNGYIIYKKFPQPYQFIVKQIEDTILCHCEARSNLPSSSQQNIITIPVCYDISLGIDLAEMSTAKGISIEEIIQLHTQKKYRVYMLGFLPGFAYMGRVDEKIATPRKQTPRLTIEAGAVGIAGEQTGIYPFNSPGGWNIIGRTPLKMFDAAREQPSLLQPGDEVQFKQIDLKEFKTLSQV